MKLSINHEGICRVLGLEPGLRCLKELGFDNIDYTFIETDPHASQSMFSGDFRQQMADVSALLKEIDLSGKKVVPFCSFGSGGLDSSVKDLKAQCPGAEILPGYGVRAARIAAVPKEVDQFLKANGFLEGEYVKLEAFPEQHPVTEEEAAIFDAAVNGYPMLNAKASAVASRAIPDGVEYLFTALPVPREPDAKMPPATEMKVYVTVEEGQAPVFTQVVR